MSRFIFATTTVVYWNGLLGSSGGSATTITARYVCISLSTLQSWDVCSECWYTCVWLPHFLRCFHAAGLDFRAKHTSVRWTHTLEKRNCEWAGTQICFSCLFCNTLLRCIVVVDGMMWLWTLDIIISSFPVYVSLRA
jgi:hypothetical protein